MKKSASKEIMKFRADPVLRCAIKLRAAYLDVDLQDVVVELLRKGLCEEIKEVQRRGPGDKPSPAKEEGSRGRPSRPEKRA